MGRKSEALVGRHNDVENWINEEFGDVEFGDTRLKVRLFKIASAFANFPDSPINQACHSWTETKAAYRFFNNEKVDPSEITKSHVQRTAERAKQYETILAIQDTSYILYTTHKRTSGLATISSVSGDNVKTISTFGLAMHTCLAVTTEGLPLGILDQSIYSRSPKKKTVRSERVKVVLRFP